MRIFTLIKNNNTENLPNFEPLAVTLKWLINSIDSILKSSIENFELIIVDNNSFDGTAEYISNNHPSIKLIANNSNVGFGKAVNQGAKIANSEHLLILNPDTIIEEDTLEKLINYIDSKTTWTKKRGWGSVESPLLVTRQRVCIMHNFHNCPL